MYKYLLKLFLILSITISCTPYNADANADAAMQVKYGIYVKKIVPDFKKGTFWAKFYWWMLFDNDSTITNMSDSDIIKIEYVNGVNVSPDDIYKELQDTKTSTILKYYNGIHEGEFYFNPDYKKYPFDVQNLTIQIDHAVYDKRELVFIVDTNSFIESGQDKKRWGLSYELYNDKSVNYDITHVEHSIEDGLFNTNFGNIELPHNSIFSRYNLNIEITRLFMPFISKLIIPLIFIMSIIYLVFYLDTTKFDASIGLIVTTMFSAIAFQMSINRDLPEIGYIIYVDKIFYVCYFLIAMSVLVVLLRYVFEKSSINNYTKKIRTINIWSRILFPIIFFSSLFIMV